MAKQPADDDLDSEGQEGEGGNKKKKLIIIVAVLVLLLAGGGAAAYFMGLLPFGAKTEEKETAAADGKEAGKPEAHGGGKEAGKDGKPAAVAGPLFYDLPEFLVNLNTGGKQTSFLKMRVTLEMPDEATRGVVDANLPRIVDNFNTYLREVRASDLAGSAGTYRLKEELLTRINKTIAPASVKNVLFREMLVQ